MDFIMAINSKVDSFVWGPPMLILIVGTGMYITFKTKFFTLRKLGYIFGQTMGKVFKKDKNSQGQGEITPFQAVATALAATLGTGNIAGVATAMTIGGPGAIFWMWISAFFGMATKYAEVVLSIRYRETNEDGSFVGGPMYYLKNGLKKPWLAILFSIFASIAALGIGNMVQSNSVADSLFNTFGVNKVVTGLVLAVIVALAMFGGLKRIASITEKLVPFMAIFYLGGALLVLLFNISRIPEAFAVIVKSALGLRAVGGGVAGSAVVAMSLKAGIARGVFSNEAGLGSAPIAHAPATTDHPVKQGIWGVFEVFMSTIVICTMTALAILVGVDLEIIETGALTGTALTTAAFEGTLGTMGGYIVSIGLLCFALSTLLSWSYYGEVSLDFLFGKKVASAYKFIWVPLVFVGSVASLDVVWSISNTFNGLMAIPNLIGVFGLSKIVIDLTLEYFDLGEKSKSKKESYAEEQL